MRHWLFRVGAPGIEPGPYVPKTYILPIYYAPKLLPYTSIYIGEVKNPACVGFFTILRIFYGTYSD